MRRQRLSLKDLFKKSPALIRCHERMAPLDKSIFTRWAIQDLLHSCQSDVATGWWVIGTMERGQGKPLSPEKIEKIKKLLATSDLSMPDIAERMGCARGRVVSINRKFQIRLYGTKRSSWVVNKDCETPPNYCARSQ